MIFRPFSRYYQCWHHLLSIQRVVVCLFFWVPLRVVGQTFQFADYLALQPGTWTYAPSGGATAKIIAAGSSFTRELGFEDGPFSSTFSLTPAGLVFNKDSFTPAAGVDELPFTETQNSMVVVIPAQLIMGGPNHTSSGSYTGVEPGNTYVGNNSFVTTFNGVETLTVPAGTFSTLKITIVSSWSDGDESGTTTNVVWLAEGRGIIKLGFTVAIVGEPEFGTEFSLTSSPPRPATPTGVMASDGTEIGQIAISWAPIIGSDEYLISRSTEASPASATLLASTTTTTFTDTTVEGDTTYYYFIRSRIGGANSEFSSPNSGQAAVVIPVTPVVNIGQIRGELELRWISQVGVKYQIQNSTTLRDWKPAEPTPRDGNGDELVFKLDFGTAQPDFIYYRVTIVD